VIEPVVGEAVLVVGFIISESLEPRLPSGLVVWL
jgi:hypothetical protein